MTNEEITAVLEKHADDLFRFAFVLTLSEEGAMTVMKEAVGDMTAKNKWDAEDVKKELLGYIYKRARKYGTAALDKNAVTGKYGPKSDEFFDFLSQPFEERAKGHLSMYEDMTDEEIAKVTE